MHWKTTRTRYGSDWRVWRGQHSKRPCLHRHFAHLPVSESVEVALAQVPAFFDKWVAVANDSESTYWQQVDYREDVVAAPPTHFIGGWYDIFVDEMLDDYVRQVAQGQQPFLTVRPGNMQVLSRKCSR